MIILTRYQRFLYRRFLMAGKSGALGEVSLQMLPWVSLSLLGAVMITTLFDFVPNSYPQIAIACAAVAPWFVGLFAVYRAWLHVSGKLTGRETMFGTGNA